MWLDITCIICLGKLCDARALVYHIPPKSLFFPQDLAAKIDQASEAGEQFAKLYYETYDKKRHVSWLKLTETLIGISEY